MSKNVLESTIRLQNYVPNIPGMYMTYVPTADGRRDVYTLHILVSSIYVTYTCFSDPLVLQGFKEAIINTGVINTR
jgi:hypothetical protein